MSRAGGRGGRYSISSGVGVSLGVKRRGWVRCDMRTDDKHAKSDEVNILLRLILGFRRRPGEVLGCDP